MPTARPRPARGAGRTRGVAGYTSVGLYSALAGAPQDVVAIGRVAEQRGIWRYGTSEDLGSTTTASHDTQHLAARRRLPRQPALSMREPSPLPSMTSKFTSTIHADNPAPAAHRPRSRTQPRRISSPQNGHFPIGMDSSLSPAAAAQFKAHAQARRQLLAPLDGTARRTRTAARMRGLGLPLTPGGLPTGLPMVRVGCGLGPIGRRDDRPRHPDAVVERQLAQHRHGLWRPLSCDARDLGERRSCLIVVDTSPRLGIA